MKIRYDKEADAAYISFREKGKLQKTISVSNDIVVDFGSHGKVMGVEILNARSHIAKNDLRRAVSRKVDIPLIKLV